MKVELTSDRQAWDTFVSNNPRASNYHRWPWLQVVEQTYGHKPFYLSAIEDDRIVGVLPLSLIDSRVFGRHLVSVPFFSYGGVLANTDQAIDALLTSATERGKE